MNNYLIDREILERTIDELLKQKPLAGDAQEQQEIREKLIVSLDKKIGYAIFGQLTEEQKATCSQMLDDENLSEDDFEKFFAEAGVDVEKTMLEVMKKFAEIYLGGQNAE